MHEQHLLTFKNCFGINNETPKLPCDTFSPTRQQLTGKRVPNDIQCATCAQLTEHVYTIM